jgi:hypothetical protein
VLNHTLNNTSNSTQGVVVYNITPTSPLGCAGSVFYDTVFVNPKPVASTSGNQTICSGNTSSVALSATTGGATTFAWTATGQANILLAEHL